MRKLKQVFIYNETYPLPEDAYKHYSGKVAACSKNPMCLNNVKSDVEGYIAKWGKQAGIKIEEDDESSFTILKDGEDFDVMAVPGSKRNLSIVKVAGIVLIIVFAVLSIQKKSILYGIITLLLTGLVFGMFGNLYSKFGATKKLEVQEAPKETETAETDSNGVTKMVGQGPPVDPNKKPNALPLLPLES